MTREPLPELTAPSARSLEIHSGSRFRRVWLWPNLLSLDAVFVALLWQELFARSFSIELSAAERAALGLAVWIIYIADRVLDGYSGISLPSSRHIFYRRHRVLATATASLALLAEIWVCLHLNAAILHAGFLLSAVVVFHFISVHNLPAIRYPFAKETMVAMVFAMGTALVTLTRVGLRTGLIFPVSVFALICLLNCAGVEYSEWQRFASVGPGEPSRSAAWLTTNLQLITACIILVATALMATTVMRDLYGSLAIGALGLFWFGVTHHRMTADQMRVAADVPLMIPALLLLASLHGL
jgi:hypothetical protein